MSAVPLTLHVEPRVVAATIYHRQTRLRRAAPLAFATAVEEVQVMVPMPAKVDGQASFDRDSVQVEFGAAFDGKVILAGVAMEDVNRTCLRSDGVVDIAMLRQKPSDEQENRDGAIDVPSSTKERRKLQSELEAVEKEIKLKNIALQEAAQTRDFIASMAEAAVSCTDGVGPLVGSPSLHQADMWDNHLNTLENAKLDYLKKSQQLLRETASLEKDHNRITAELRRFRGSFHTTSVEGDTANELSTVSMVVLTLKVLEPIAASAAGDDAVVYISYMVNGGYWNANYEVHLNTCTNELQLYYNAEVAFLGRDDLNDITLTLCSAVPRIQAALPPSMDIWRCGIIEPAPPPTHQMMDEAICMMAAEPAMEARTLRVAPARKMIRRAVVAAPQVETGGIVNFKVPTQQNIPSNGTTTRVPLTVLTIPADISYVSVPEKLEAAFTHAKMKNTSDFLLLSGEASVFMDGNYVSRTSLSPQCFPGGSFAMDFGIDRSIEVKRVLLRNTTKPAPSSLIKKGKRTITSFVYRLTVRNKKVVPAVGQEENADAAKQEAAILIKLLERIPISNEEELQVRLIEPEKPAEEVLIYEDEADKKVQLERKVRELQNDGIVEKELRVGSGESVTYQFSFEVEAPKGVKVNGL